MHFTRVFLVRRPATNWIFHTDTGQIVGGVDVHMLKRYFMFRAAVDHKGGLPQGLGNLPHCLVVSTLKSVLYPYLV